MLVTYEFGVPGTNERPIHHRPESLHILFLAPNTVARADPSVFMNREGEQWEKLFAGLLRLVVLLTHHL